MNSSKQTLEIFWTPKRIAMTIIALALLASFGLSSCGGTPETPNANAPKVEMTVNTSGGTKPAEPRSLPAAALDAQLKTIEAGEGKPFKLSDLKGKVLVIDLWATWCGPCVYEVPELVKLQSDFGPRGFEIIGLDIDPENDEIEDVRAFMKKFKINYKVAYAERSVASSLMRGGNIPQSLVVGKDGRILLHLVGFDRVTTPQRIREAIEQALEEKG